MGALNFQGPRAESVNLTVQEPRRRKPSGDSQFVVHLRSAVQPVSVIQETRPDLERPENRELLGHWEKIRGDAPVPLRAQFNPMDVPRHLPNLIVLEPKVPDNASVRIFGTELARRLGFDLTGIDLFSMYDGQRAREVVDMISHVVEQQAIAVAYSEWTTPSGHTFTTENLWMPLASQEGPVNRVLGSVWEVVEARADVDDLGGALALAQLLSRRAYYKF